VVDNPLFREGRIASITVVGRSLANELHEGYKSLWIQRRDYRDRKPLEPLCTAEVVGSTPTRSIFYYEGTTALN
jgi:hypothetical protein